MIIHCRWIILKIQTLLENKMAFILAMLCKNLMNQQLLVGLDLFFYRIKDWNKNPTKINLKFKQKTTQHNQRTMIAPANNITTKYGKRILKQECKLLYSVMDASAIYAY